MLKLDHDRKAINGNEGDNCKIDQTRQAPTSHVCSKTVHFGAKGGSTYIDHKDPKTKANWEARHKVRENWNDYDSAGTLSKHVLWNKPSLAASIRDLNARQKQYDFVLKKGANQARS